MRKEFRLLIRSAPRRILCLVLVLLYGAVSTTSVSGLAADQKQAMDGGIYYFNIKDCTAADPGATAAPRSSVPIPNPQPVVDNTGIENAYIPDDRLSSMNDIPNVRVTGSNMIRTEIVPNLTILAEAFKARFERDLHVFSGYRNAAQQQQSIDNATRENAVAPVGQSSHGWGLAIDIEQAVLHDQDSNTAFETEVYKWLSVDAVKLGWKNPYYKDHGGQAAEEPWHWEYGTTSSWGAGTNGQTSLNYRAPKKVAKPGLWQQLKNVLVEKAMAQEGPAPEGDSDISNETSTTNGGEAFMVGDSITNGSKSQLETAIKGKGFTTVEIDARDGRPLSEGTEIFEGSPDRYKDASAVIIALGTNGGFTAESITKTIETIKQNAATAKIYWVNIGVDNSKRDGADIDAGSLNTLLQDNSSLGYTVVDWSAQVTAHPEYIDPNPTTGLGVHPIGDGKQAFADTVANGLTGGGTIPSSAGSNCTCTASGSSTLSGSTNEEKTWNFLRSKGMSVVQAAGAMGNMKHEGNFIPDQLEIAFSDPPHKWDKPLELPAVRGPAGQPGLGIVQWTSPGRKDKLLDFAKSQPEQTMLDLRVQLEFMWIELNGPYKESSLDPLLATDDLAEATRIWQTKYEVGAGFQPRYDAAVEYMATYGSNTAGTTTSATSNSVSCATNATGGVVGGMSLPVDKKWYDDNNKIFSNEHWAGDAAVDISVPTGTPIYSMTNGKILVAPAGGDCGQGVTIQSESGGHWVYCHGLDGGAIEGARQGDTVKAGQLIMNSDNTGRSSGPHLHINITEGGKLICPQPLLVSIAKGAPMDIGTVPTTGCTNGL